MKIMENLLNCTAVKKLFGFVKGKWKTGKTKNRAITKCKFQGGFSRRFDVFYFAKTWCEVEKLSNVTAPQLAPGRYVAI